MFAQTREQLEPSSKHAEQGELRKTAQVLNEKDQRRNDPSGVGPRSYQDDAVTVEWKDTRQVVARQIPTEMNGARDARVGDTRQHFAARLKNR